MTAPALAGLFPDSYRAPYDPQVPPELIEEVKGMSESLLDKIRHKCKTDRYFLASGVLGYADVNPFTHGPLCRAVEDTSFKRRMYLMPRGHLKTTLATITDSVALALADPEETRILIVNEIEDNAIGFLSEIKAHFENNDLIAELFPDLIPKKFGGPGSKWSTTRACLPRSTAYKEWTWTAAGVGKALAGNHFNRIKLDDLIGFEAKESPAAMRYAISFAKALEPLLINMDEDIIDWIGTRWGIYDLYREMLNIYREDMAYFAREDIEDGKPIFPTKFSLRTLHRMSVIDPVLYYAQYKNNPIADGIKDFNADNVQWFDFDRYGNVAYRDEFGFLQRWPREQLDIVMSADPNGGDLAAKDFPAIIVAAQSPRNQIFVFDAWSRRVQPDAFVDRIYEMWEQWNPRVLGIEKAGQQSTLFYFKRLANERKIFINVEPLLHKNREKAARIRKALQPLVNDKLLFLRRGQSMLQHQIRFHPDLDNDDEIDALAYVTELVHTPLDQKGQEDEDRATRLIMNSRSPVTGYGR